MKNGKTPNPGKFLPLAAKSINGKLLYPRQISHEKNHPDATELLRQLLSIQKDHSVTMVQVGFSTNFARLLKSGPDKHSPLSGKELVAKKVNLLSIMAGAFHPIKGKTHLEYNIVQDIPSAQELAANWPTPIVWSGFEIGLAIRYPAKSIEEDYNYVEHHPLAEAYQLYNPTPHERPTWDLTSVLYAVFPERNYFDLSETGKVSVKANGETIFQPIPQGKHRYLKVNPLQIERIKEAFVQLASQPPGS